MTMSELVPLYSQHMLTTLMENPAKELAAMIQVRKYAQQACIIGYKQSFEVGSLTWKFCCYL